MQNMEAALRILNELEAEGVFQRYAIGGAVGAIFYMEPFLTYDLGVFITLPSSENGLINLNTLYAALRKRGYQEDKEFVNIEGVPVQFLPAHNALVEEALSGAIEIPYEAIKTRVFKPEYLAAIMLQTGRSKDRQRFSSFLAEAEFDRARLEQIVGRHNLENRWKEWTT